MNCTTCNDTRHVYSDSDGGFVRCPDCFVRISIQRKLMDKGLPTNWMNYSISNPDVVAKLDGILDGTYKRGHIVSVLESRYPLLAHLTCSWMLKGQDVTYLDTAKLAPDHYNKDRKNVDTLFNVNGPIIIQVGDEIEAKIGSFYLKGYIERSVMWNLPLVVFSNSPTHLLQVRYPDLSLMLKNASFDFTDYTVKL